MRLVQFVLEHPWARVPVEACLVVVVAAAGALEGTPIVALLGSIVVVWLAAALVEWSLARNDPAGRYYAPRVQQPTQLAARRVPQTAIRATRSIPA